MGRLLGEIEWEQRARTKVALVLPQGHAAEASLEQVVVSVVPGVSEIYTLEQTMVCPKDVVCLGPHLLATMEHAPHTSFPRSQNLAREEVLQLIV